MMFKFRLRIGAKLGASAAFGVLFVIAMVANQVRVNAVTDRLGADVKRSIMVDRAVLEAEIGLRRVAIQNRVLQLAGTVQDVDDVAKRVNEYGGAAVRALDTALASAVRPENREALAKAKELYGGYVAAIVELAQVQKEVVDLRLRQSSEGRAWPDQLNALLNGSAMAAAPNRADLIRALEHADSAFKQGRLVAWAKLLIADGSQAGRMQASFDQALKLMEQAREMADDRAIKDGIDQLRPLITQFRGLVDKLDATIARRDTLSRERADPLRVKADEITDKVKIGVRSLADELEAMSSAHAVWALRANIGAGAAIVVVLIGSALLSIFHVARPIRRIGNVLLDLANGNKAVEIPYAMRGDEVGDNARAAQTFKENLLRIEQMELEQKDAERRAAAQQKAEMHKLAHEFETAIGSIVDSVSSSSTELEAAADTLTKTADVTHQLAGSVAAASEQASANVQSVASATEQMTSSVNEIARQVQESAKIANEAVGQAQQTDARIGELSQAAQRIGDVVKLITAIAEQTNLLALNATIEAARAGEAGRGFAVVAQEVKALAAQTAKATDEISTHIAGMQTATRDSVGAIKQIGGTIARISEIASTIAAAVEEQDATTREIARNVNQAAQGTSQVAGNIGDVNKGAAETGSASSQVLASARALSSEGGKLKIEVEKFLTTVRAA